MMPNQSLQSPTKKVTKCSCCGALVPDDYESCAAMFQAVLAREYSDPACGEAHLFTVDAHALQHWEEHGPRSNAFHLMRLCWLLEHGGNPSIRQVRKGGRAFYDVREETYRHFPFLAPPTSRGALTVLSLLLAQTPEEHAQRGRAWGQCVWDTWSAHHTWAREQCKQWFRSHAA